MSFQALARTWRPRRFDELVGQAHVVRALGHALDNDKLHHALLFSGTRGVGKTTLARIIAKCLNCEHGVSSRPCHGEDMCGSCREIDQARFVDLIEVDAASRTGVDDTRELMDNVQYAPTRGRTKVYLIDEVHMLSKHSFNALLKTLEEPPPRVQFLLATTEPEKIPVTILSRCLQFPLKRLPVAQIAGQLRHVVDAESIEAQPDALDALARAADGSMRDGLSLLDQAIAFGGGRLQADDVRDMLGTIGQARVAELVAAIVDADCAAAMQALDALYGQGIDMRYLLDALASAWHDIAVIQIVGEPADEAAARWQPLAARAETASVQIFYDIALAGIRDHAYAPDPLIAARMSVLRMLALTPAAQAFESGQAPQPATGGAPDTSAEPSTGHAASRAPDAGAAAGGNTPRNAEPSRGSEHTDTPSANGKSTVNGAKVAGLQQGDEPAADTPSPGDAGGTSLLADQAAPLTPTDKSAQDWVSLVGRLELNGFAAQLAGHAACRQLDDERVVLALARANEFLATAGARDGLEAALARYWQPAEPPRLVIEFVDRAAGTPAQRSRHEADERQREAEAAIANDPLVARLRERLGAELRPETIKPNRPSGAAQQRDER